MTAPVETEEDPEPRHVTRTLFLYAAISLALPVAVAVLMQLLKLID